MSSDELQDGELISRVAAGDAEAFAQLFRRRQGQVYRFALHMTASPSIAEDVTQEVFLAVMSDAGRYDGGPGISRRLALRDRPEPRAAACGAGSAAPAALRWRGSETDSDGWTRLLVVEANTLGDLTRAESIEALREAVLTLPVKYREAVVLCDLQEMTYADAATASGVPSERFVPGCIAGGRCWR